MPSPDHPLPFRQVLEPIRGGRVLDVAAGTGPFTRTLVDCLGSFEEIIGIDTNERAVARAKDGFPEANVRFQQADATALPFPDEHFDTLALANSLHHLERLDRAVSEMRRVLKPGGHWILLEMHADALTAASRNAVDLHLWAAAVDRALGRFHAPVLTRQALVEQIDALALCNPQVAEWHGDENEDPFGNLEATIQVIEQVLKQAVGTPEETDLGTQAGSLMERIRRGGLCSQPFLLVVGTTSAGR